MAHLRKARQMRQAKRGTTKSELGQIVNMVSIRERSAEVEDTPCRATGNEISSSEGTTRTSQRWSSAITYIVVTMMVSMPFARKG